MLGVLAGTMGILQASEAIKEILGIGESLADKLVIYDALEMKFRKVSRPKDPRIKAAIAFSPSAPRRGDPQKAFGSVPIPWLLMTGTKDVSLIGDADLASRLAVYPALPPGGKYELVLEGAEHSAFGDRPLPGDSETRNPNHHRAVLALSTAFWDAYLLGDKSARQWLDGDAARSVLEPKDRWQRK